MRTAFIFGSILAAALAGVAPGCANEAAAQQVAIPRPGTGPQPAGPLAADSLPKIFDAAHLKDRPYDGSLPAPAFPSTARVQRTFTVAMVYDYAYTAYAPAVPLPIISKLQAARDTPEAAATAFFSAQRSGDFQAFLSCWTEEDRKKIPETMKNAKVDEATVIGKWKQFYGTKPVELFDRIETTGYVILDARVAGSAAAELPVVLKLVKGQWLATNDLGDSGSPMLGAFKRDQAGLLLHVQPVPVAQLGNPGRRLQAEAQQQFMENRTRRNEIDEAGR